MAVSALQSRSARTRAVQPVIAAVLAACAAVLCLAIVAIGGWLAVTGVPASLHVLDPYAPGSVLAPLVATAYVTTIALPLSALVGVLAAFAATEVRIFGAAATGMRGAIGLLGSIPTVVMAFAALIAVNALGWRPTLSGAALLLAVVNAPLMTALALGVLSRKSTDVREAAMALGASPMFIVRRVLLPKAQTRLWRAIIIVGTQIIGAAAAIAIIAGARVGAAGDAPVGAWPLAVHVWMRGGDIGGYRATAAAALFLTLLIWLLQGAAQLRSGPDYRSREAR